jgi:pyruvate formate lyase activating enzyme
MKTKSDKNFVTKYWRKLDDGRIQCDLCPHHCKLKPDQQGLCFVRANENDQVVLTTYGRASGFCIDPVEKKPLNHFLPGTSVLSFGTVGCNLACKFCQNWQISKAREMSLLTEKASPQKIAKMAQENKCQSVAYTYNEPIISLEYCVDTAKECHKLGIKSIAVTNGFICDEPRKEFFAHMDAANVDLKGFTEKFYRKITNSSLQPVLDTLVYVKHKTNVWLEITNLLIPGENDSEKEIDAMTKWIVKEIGVDVPLHFSAFFPAFKMMDYPATPEETLTRAREIAIKNGIRYAYTGNVYDEKGSSTYCHNCHNCIIKRGGFNILDYQLTDDGHCKFCNTLCAGVFAGPVGKWGAKRKPVLM